MWETGFQSLGWEDPLEKGKATHPQCSGLENSMDCIVQGIAKSQTWLSHFHFHLPFALARPLVICCFVLWVANLCLTLCDPMGCSPPGASVLGILQAKRLEWVAVSFSRGSSWPRDWTTRRAQLQCGHA